MAGKTALQDWVKSGEKVVVFVDGTNFYNTIRQLNFEVDYLKFRELFSTSCNLMRIYYFTAVGENAQETPVLHLLSWMEYNGYSTVTKPAKNLHDPERAKGNIDIELCVYMLRVAHLKYMDHAILVSGDGDFKYLVEEVQNLGIKVSVMSTIRTNPIRCADELIRQADNFIELENIRQYIFREPADAQVRSDRRQNHYPRSQTGRGG